MADSIVEKYNGTILAGSYTANQQTLFSTDSATSVVIKDVTVANNTYSASPSLLVNGTPINTLSTSLTGTALIGPNSTVKIQNNQTSMALVGFGAFSPDPNTKQWYQTTTPSYTSWPLVSGALAGTPASYSTNLSSYSSNVACWYVNGDFYYYNFDGNSTTQFYKRTGGPDGSQTTICSDSYAPVCFDGVSKFYYLTNGGTLYRYDTSNGTSTYMYGYQSTTTYPTIAYCNRYIFLQVGYSGYSMYVFNTATGSNVGGSVSLANSYGSQTALLVLNVPGTNAYNLYHMSTNGTAGSMARNQLIVGGSSVSNGSQSNTAGVNFYSNSAFSNVQNGSYVAVFGSASSASTIYVLDSSLAVVSKITAPVNFTSNYAGWFGMGLLVNSPTNTQLNAYGPQIQLRISGIQST